MERFGKLLDCSADGNKLTLTFDTKVATVEVITDRIINIFVPFATKEHFSKAIEGKKAKKTPFTWSFENGKVTVETAHLKAVIEDDMMTDFFDKSGALLCKDYRGEMVPVIRMSDADLALMAQEGHKIDRAAFDKEINIVKSLEKDEMLFGLGDKAGFMDRRGYEYTMWNTDTSDIHNEQMPTIYKSIPFYISKKRHGAVYGIFFDNTCKSVFNMGKDSPDYLWYGVDGGNLDYYFMAGDTIEGTLGLFTYLTGTTPLPQRWTLGYQQSRWGYVDEADVRYITDTMRECRVPCDAIHLDIDYMERYKIFTWNRERYSDPKKTVEDLGKKGFKVVTIIDPAIKIEKGYPIYEEGLKKGYFATDENGLPYVNKVWPGESLFPDFGNPKVSNWWSKNLKFHTDMGVSGIWNDMNEPASFKGELPQSVVFHDGERETTHAEMHNVYGHLMDRATYNGIKKETGKRPYVITRACYAGTQKYATAWTGDNRSMWVHLRVLIPQLCSLGISGMSFVGTDIGGFIQDTTPELLTRWVEAALFSPLFRNHCNKGSRYQEPWRFGEETLDIYRKFVEMRYSFIPYIYDLFQKGEKTGLPIMRPLALHFENDDKAVRCNTQFMAGDRIMSAPVLEPGMTERAVYLPSGTWYDCNTGEKLKGGQTVIANAPLDTLPLYARAGSIIPKYPKMQYVGEIPLDTLILEVYPGSGTYEHYNDNGEDFAYRRGEYDLYKFTVKKDGTVSGKLIKDGYVGGYKKIIVRCMGEEKTVTDTKEFKVSF